MTFLAFMDESEKDDVFAMAGYISTVGKWADFSKEWSALLRPFGTLASNGKYHFHTTEMKMNMEREGRIAYFYRTIEKHVNFGIYCVFRVSDLRAAQARLQTPWQSVEFGPLGEPYLFAWKFLIDQFHKNRLELVELIPNQSAVDFIFDERQKEKVAILGVWDEYLGNQPPEIGQYFGAKPRFESDHDFLPLQAADFLAYEVREAFEKNTLNRLIDGRRFGQFDLRQNLSLGGYAITQDMMVDIYSAYIEARFSAQ